VLGAWLLMALPVLAQEQAPVPTSDHLIAGALKARLEYRLDHIDSDYFTKSDGTKTGDQATLTLGLVCGLSGKI
jgi:hypothetical protein